jgi:hypothetical protein
MDQIDAGFGDELGWVGGWRGDAAGLASESQRFLAGA